MFNRYLILSERGGVKLSECILNEHPRVFFIASMFYDCMEWLGN